MDRKAKRKQYNLPPSDRSAADVLGPWVETEGPDTGLVQRCRRNWTVPAKELSNGMLATFIRQDIAPTIMIPEARKRIAAGFHDDSELFDDELAQVVSRATRSAD
jgi:hypothetical protein